MIRIASALELARVAARRLGHPERQSGYIGWVGKANLGDEAMLEAASNLIGTELDPVSTPAVERLLDRAGLGGEARFPIAFLGGGTLINSGYIDIVETCLDQGIALATLGTGVGSSGFHDKESRLDPRWADALRRFKSVGVRGPRSLKKMRSIGIDRAEIVGDLAMALTPDSPVADWNGRKLIFNTCAGRSSDDANVLQAFDRSIAPVLCELHKSGWQIIPVAFHSSDIDPIRQVLEQIALADIPIARPATFTDYVCLAQGAALSISVRLHGSVLASMCGVPGLLLGYRDKCYDFAESIGSDASVLDYRQTSEDLLRARIAEMVDDLEATGKSVHARCLRYRSRLQAYVASLRRTS
jgi:polysaccharide pyruvyl transferase WcaK-like protein